jgi:co-chaperonin GroES (HSP10)
MADEELAANSSLEQAESQAVATAAQETDTKSKKKVKHKEGDKFHLKVYSPFKVYFDGDIVSVSAINTTGPFDVLAGHHNFLTLLAPCEIIVRGDTEEKIKITRGIMHVKADDVVVFLDV